MLRTLLWSGLGVLVLTVATLPAEAQPIPGVPQSGAMNPYMGGIGIPGSRPYYPFDPVNAYFGWLLANQIAFPNQGPYAPAQAPATPSPPPATGNLDKVLAAAGVPVDEQQWPLGLRILPGSAPYRQRIESLFRLGATQAKAGQLNPALPQQIKQAVTDFERYLRQDKQNRMSLTWSMYDEGAAFLRRLERAPQVIQAMNVPAANPYTPASESAARK
jgi:hypothetical protein